MTLDLAAPLEQLALALVDIPSVSDAETPLADALAAALTGQAHLQVLRDGDTIVARTHTSRPRRVIVAGHIDTVPIAGNVPGRIDGTDLWGRGSVDMKGGVAVMARLAAALTAPKHDITWVFYDHEEVAAHLSGLGRTMAHHPEWISGDFAVLGEPTGGAVEAGCNGVLRVAITFHGKAAHAARAWMGVNAIHAAAPLLRRLATWTPRRAQVDGLEYTESLGAVRIMGGTASNVIPDRCEVEVNYRFAPDRDEASALAWLLGFLDLNADAADGPVPSVRVLDSAAAARPGLRWPAAQEFLAAAASEGLTEVKPKLGWTDVARFSAAGIPAVNCGPGDASLAHRDDEHCPLGQLHQVEAALRAWLT